MRTLAMPKTAEPWSLTSLREKLIKIGATVLSHSRYVTFQMAEVAVPRQTQAGTIKNSSTWYFHHSSQGGVGNERSLRKTGLKRFD